MCTVWITKWVYLCIDTCLSSSLRRLKFVPWCITHCATVCRICVTLCLFWVGYIRHRHEIYEAQINRKPSWLYTVVLTQANKSKYAISLFLICVCYLPFVVSSQCTHWLSNRQYSWYNVRCCCFIAAHTPHTFDLSIESLFEGKSKYILFK